MPRPSHDGSPPNGTAMAGPTSAGASPGGGAMTGAGSATIHVVQGECAISDRPDNMLTTVLGSCVSACIYDPQLGVGGMNHFLLPDTGADSGDNRYAAAAMEVLVNGLLRRGAARNRLEAKLFGGARMLAGLYDIGQRNALAARRFLEVEGIAVVKSDFGGTHARRIRFWPVGGRVQMILVDGTSVPRPELPARSGRGEMELF